MKILVKKPPEKLIEKLKVKSWPIWECPASEFDWHYGEEEICFFLEGKVMVAYDGGEVEIKSGDLAVFPKGLSVKWKVSEAVKKHYAFGDYMEMLEKEAADEKC